VGYDTVSYDPYQLRSVHDDAANRLHMWYNNYMKQEQEVTKSAKPDLVKIGPKGYIHGWIKVGSPAHDELNQLTGSKAYVKGYLDSAYNNLGSADIAQSHGDSAAERRKLYQAHSRLKSASDMLADTPHKNLKKVVNRASKKVTRDYYNQIEPTLGDSSLRYEAHQIHQLYQNRKASKSNRSDTP
jgi:hypothetical protein